MINYRILTILSATFIAFTMSTAQAALVERLGGLAYYDDVADITWSANATSNRMTWQDANDWANNLNIAGVTGWRLPESTQPDTNCSSLNGPDNSSGFNCTNSEMGNLFYNVLGGSAGSTIYESHNSNFDLFSNVELMGYWTGTEFELNLAHAWNFNFSVGVQGRNNKDFTLLFSWAVHSGDVAAVPVPAAVWLFISGLLGLFGIARYRH